MQKHIYIFEKQCFRFCLFLQPCNAFTLCRENGPKITTDSLPHGLHVNGRTRSQVSRSQGHVNVIIKDLHTHRNRSGKALGTWAFEWGWWHAMANSNRWQGQREMDPPTVATKGLGRQLLEERPLTSFSLRSIAPRGAE